VSAKIFVGNLDFKTTRDEIQTLFSQVGEIRDIFLPNDRDTGRPRGFAFVEYANDEDAAKAIERFDRYEMNGRALRVNAAENRPSGGGGGGYGGGGGRPQFDRGPGGGGGGGGGRFGEGKPKGSRRNIRGKKRSL
jgi:RNA recognition motif-containing protein